MFGNGNESKTNEEGFSNTMMNFDTGNTASNMFSGVPGASTPEPQTGLTKTQNSMGLGISAGSSLFNAWMGMQQLDQGRKNFKEQKSQFNRNFGMQQDAYDRQIADQDLSRSNDAQNSAKFRNLNSPAV